MRTIKFKGKDKFTGAWHFGDVLQKIGYKTIADMDNSDYTNVIPETVCQYTGLRDMDGKEIYEGDILECKGKRKDNEGMVYRRTVEFRKGAFMLVEKRAFGRDFATTLASHLVNGRVDWRVVGNIHDEKKVEVVEDAF